MWSYYDIWILNIWPHYTCEYWVIGQLWNENTGQWTYWSNYDMWIMWTYWSHYDMWILWTYWSHYDMWILDNDIWSHCDMRIQDMLSHYDRRLLDTSPHYDWRLLDTSPHYDRRLLDTSPHYDGRLLDTCQLLSYINQFIPTSWSYTTYYSKYCICSLFRSHILRHLLNFLYYPTNVLCEYVYESFCFLFSGSLWRMQLLAGSTYN